MNMNKRYIIIFLVVAILLSSCQKTPEESVVADKSHGLPEGSMIPKEKEKPKDLDLPEHWQETLIRGDGFVTLEVNHYMDIPEVYNTPVYAWEAVSMSEEFLGNLCDYFSNGDKIYEYQGMTKSELEEEKEKLEEQKSSASYLEYDAIEEALKALDKAIEKAPEKNGERKYIKPKLTEPQMTKEEQKGAKVFLNDGYYSWYYDTDKEIGFLARLERGEGCDPLIRAVSYDKDVGSVSAFMYQQGTWTDQKQAERNLEMRATIGTEEEAESYERTLGMIEQSTCEDFTEEDAKKMVENMVEDLNIQDMEISDCVKMIGSSDTENWNELDLSAPGLEAGYSFHLYPQAGDVSGYTLQRSKQYDNLPETSYAPTFLTAHIEIMVTEDGVKKFEWDYISEKGDMIAENTKLLSFDEIKEKLADHLFYAQLSTEGGEIPLDASFVYEVKDVQLRASNINAYEDPYAAWLVPVWVFEVGLTGVFVQDDGKSREKILGSSVVLINAIDGGYISVPL